MMYNWIEFSICTILQSLARYNFRKWPYLHKPRKICLGNVFGFPTKKSSLKSIHFCGGGMLAKFVVFGHFRTCFAQYLGHRENFLITCLGNLPSFFIPNDVDMLFDTIPYPWNWPRKVWKKPSSMQSPHCLYLHCRIIGQRPKAPNW